MRFNFSAEFLKITPPDTTFGQAWESLCFDLLKAELLDNSLIQLNPPDCGVDILHRKLNTAYQCKSKRIGSSGTLSAKTSLTSLERACMVQNKLGWVDYFFATNANYSSKGIISLFDKAKDLGLDISNLDFRGPDYWNDLCKRHYEKVRDRLDYRIMVTEEQVIEALKKARYYDQYVQKYGELIKSTPYKLTVTNNRTEAALEIPFSPELTVKNLLDVVHQLLGVNLDWTNFHDLGTSSGPNISMTIKGYSQGFSKRIQELELDSDNPQITFWIKIIWRDEIRKKGPDDDDFLKEFRSHIQLCYRPNIDDLLFPNHFKKFSTKDRTTMSYEERKALTLERSEIIIQERIWNNVFKLIDEGELGPE